MAVSAAVLAVLVALAATPQLLGSRVGGAFGALSGATPAWLWAAALGFLAALIGSSLAWRAAMAACGGRLSGIDAAARNATGSLVNALVPAKVGDAVRIALFARTIEAPERLWTTGGVYAAIGAARAVTLAALIVATAASGALPLWPVFALVGIVAALGGIAYLARNDHRHRFARLFDAIAALERSPRIAAAVLGWTAASSLAKLAAAAAIVAALGLPHPLLAALVIVPVLELAGAVPLTPGNIGVGSGAVAVALQARGIGMTDALSVGIAMQAVETIVGVGAGTAGALYLGRERARWTLRLAAVGASVGIAAALGLTVFDVA